jgi:hypothetical protein
MRAKLLLCWIAILLFAPAAFGEEFDVFIGAYEGQYVPPDGDKNKIRDLSVKVSKVKGGLNISWATTTFKQGKSKRKNYSIDFLTTEREHIYSAAQKKNVFGGREPLDPMKGEPYAWARIVDRSLTVFVLTIAKDGGYEMQTYDRILTEGDTFDVRFTRIRNGEVIRSLEATLMRISDSKLETDR